MKVFVIGPQGQGAEGLQRYRDACRALRADGHEVESPIGMFAGTPRDWTKFICDIAQVMPECDAALALFGWDSCPRAVFAMEFGRGLELRLIFIEREDAFRRAG